VAREELFAVIRSPERTTDERRRGLELLVSALETSRHGLIRFDTRRAEILRDARSKLEEFRGADVYGARLSTPPQVRFPIQALAQLFFWCWVLLLARLSWKGFDERARPQWAVLKRSALPFVAAYGLWLAALRLA
jgi:hypothetical protein